MAKKYIATPEFISRNIELSDGSNTNELYDLEHKIVEAIENATQWRVDHQPHPNLPKEEYWTNSLPMVLRNILESFDVDASKVASESFLKKEAVEIEVKKL